MNVLKPLMLVSVFLLFSSLVNSGSSIKLDRVVISKHRDASVQPYVQAYLSDKTVEVRFLQKIGNVQVQVVSSCGDVVWNQTCDTSDMDSFFIEVSPEKIGEDTSYIITITASEEILEGEFHL